MSNAQPPDEFTRYGAFYSAGLAVEADPESDPPRLSIDGQKLEVRKSGSTYTYFDEGRDFVSDTVRGLAEQIIKVVWNGEGRKKIRDEHVERLKDRDSWNLWRRSNPSIRPLLFEAPLRGKDLSGFNFCNANFIRADLREASLAGANFHEANLGGAHLNDADLSKANFCRTDLYETDFSGANLTCANLQGTQMARTNFSGAQLAGCTIYGMSAWNLKLDGATQGDLKILYRVGSEHGEFAVDDIELAQLIYLLLDNTRINNLFDQLTSKAVVILSRFEGEERKQVIATLRSRLRGLGFLPIVFDFARPPARDLTETIKTLVGLCNFAIVDLTDPRSVPLELYATITDYQVPFVPIIKAGQKPFPLFDDFEKFSWLLPTLTYESAESFTEASVKRCIIDKATDMWNEIIKFKQRQKRAPLSIEECSPT